MRPETVYHKHKTKEENVQELVIWSLPQRYCVNNIPHVQIKKAFSCLVDSHWYQCDESASSGLEESP